MKPYKLRVFEGLFLNLTAGWYFASVGVLFLKDWTLLLINLVFGTVFLLISLEIAKRRQDDGN